MKHLKTVIIVLGFIPYLYVIFLFAFYFHAGYILGHLPIPSLDDPKNLSMCDFYYPKVLFFGNVWIYSIVPLMIMISIYNFFSENDIYGKILVFIIIGNFIAFSLFLSEISTWFAD